MKSATFSLKTMALCGAAAAAAVMGILTATASSPGVGGSAAFIANGGATVTSPIPATTPTVANAAPVVKPTTFVGGDWPGMGSFGEGWAK